MSCSQRPGVGVTQVTFYWLERSHVVPRTRRGGWEMCAQDEKTFGEKLNSLCLPWRGEMMSQETQQANSGALLRAPAPGECQAPGSSSPC